MSDENKVVDLASIRDQKAGERGIPVPNKKELARAAIEEVGQLKQQVKGLEGVCEMMFRQMKMTGDKSNQVEQNLAMMCDSITVRLLAVTRYLAEKGIIDETEFNKTIENVSTEMIENKQVELDSRLSLHNVDRPSKENDVMLVDYVGKVDNVAFPGGSGVRQLIAVGAGGFVDDFDKKMTGMSAGETREIEVKFPENYGEPTLAGKVAKFTVLCRTVKERIEQESAPSSEIKN